MNKVISFSRQNLPYFIKQDQLRIKSLILGKFGISPISCSGMMISNLSGCCSPINFIDGINNYTYDTTNITDNVNTAEFQSIAYINNHTIYSNKLRINFISYINVVPEQENIIQEVLFGSGEGANFEYQETLDIEDTQIQEII